MPRGGAYFFFILEARFTGALFAETFFAAVFFTAFFGFEETAAFAVRGLAFAVDFSRTARVFCANADFSSASNSAGVNGRADLRNLSMS